MTGLSHATPFPERIRTFYDSKQDFLLSGLPKTLQSIEIITNPVAARAYLLDQRYDSQKKDALGIAYLCSAFSSIFSETGQPMKTLSEAEFEFLYQLSTSQRCPTVRPDFRHTQYLMLPENMCLPMCRTFDLYGGEIKLAVDIAELFDRQYRIERTFAAHHVLLTSEIQAVMRLTSQLAASSEVEGFFVHVENGSVSILLCPKSLGQPPALETPIFSSVRLAADSSINEIVEASVTEIELQQRPGPQAYFSLPTESVSIAVRCVLTYLSVLETRSTKYPCSA